MDLQQFLEFHPADNNKVFGAFVRHRREELGLNLKALEDATRIPSFYLEQIEDGERSAPFQLLDSFKSVLQIKESEVYDFEDLAFCTTNQHPDINEFLVKQPELRKIIRTIMYSDFTKMSAGQPRLSQVERFRQRFMHKLVYFPTNNDGMFSCVGCGRCVAKCPISMNIVKVMKTLGGEKND